MTRLTRRRFMACAGTATAASSFSSAAHALGAAAAPSDTTLKEAIDAEREHVRTALRTAQIPGAAVCLVRHGEVAWVEGFGVTGTSGQNITPDTLFSIQSTSKNMTAVGVMLAVQDGLIDLDTPITAYLPDFTVNSRFEQQPERKMTLRLLLSHRAGFTHEAPAGNNYEPDCKDFATHVRSISQTWLRFPVGERYRYSNLGFDLAAYLLEVKAGMPLSQWLQARLFEPLGMKSTTLDPEVYSKRNNRALGHEAGHRSVPLRTPLVGSGGIYTTALDMTRYSRFHLNQGRLDGQVLLQEALWQEMHGFALGGDYGLGVIRTQLRYGDSPLRMMSHQGGGFGFGCLFSYCPEAGLAYTALFNRPASAGYRLGESLLETLLRAQYGARQPALPAHDLAPIALTAAQQRAYVGNYVGRSLSADIEQRGSSLYLRTGAISKPLSFTSPNDAFTADADGGATTYRGYAPSRQASAHWECMRGEESLDYNDGPNDPAGPDRRDWQPFVGQYRIEQWGVPSETAVIHVKNGYLYINSTRLITEHQPGLFFTCDGEAVDFRSPTPTWRNILLRRVD